MMGCNVYDSAGGNGRGDVFPVIVVVNFLIKLARAMLNPAPSERRASLTMKNYE
jgi:hypothetical protein